MAEQRTAGSGRTSLVQESSTPGRDKAQAVGTQVDDIARQVSETASEYYEQGREQIAQVGNYLEDHIRTKPLQSVLIAAGLGMFMALLWKK